MCGPNLGHAQDSSVNCYQEIDPYYWGFDVPSMIRVHGPFDAYTVRQTLIHYLWKDKGWPDDKMPTAVETQWSVDDVDYDCQAITAPQDVPGLALWLDATDPASLDLDGNRVVTWRDKSGNVNDATQAATAFQPTYEPGAPNGGAAVHFDGADDVLSVPDNSTLDPEHTTIFIVLQVGSPNNVAYPMPLAKLPANSSYLFYIDGKSAIPAFRATTEYQWWHDAKDVLQTTQEAEIWTGLHDGDYVKFFRNGVEGGNELAPGTVDASTGPLHIGDGGESSTTAFSGSIAEILVYNGALPNSAREGIWAYLGCKHAIRRYPPRWTRKFLGSNLAQVDRLDIQMDYNLHSYAHLLSPLQGNHRLLIFHQGHADNMLLTGGEETIRHFLDQGFTVLAYSMPLFDQNSKVAEDVPGYGRIELVDHDDMAQRLENDQGSFIRFFVEPVIVGINYAVAQGLYDDISMVGISGGGWTTHMVAALDPRVSLSFPVAGSLPLYLRYGPCPNGSQGDAEQEWAPLFENIASWLDLYILGGYGSGRGQLHILNQYDDCCFWGVNYRTYEPFARTAVSDLGSGWYRVYLDSLNTEHRISNFVIASVIDSLLQHPGVTGAPDGGAGARALEVRVRPNPSRGTTSLVYSIAEPADGPALLEVYDLGGRLVRRFRPAGRSPGRHTEIWDGRDLGGRPVPPGVYLCRLQLGRTVSSSRIVLTR